MLTVTTLDHLVLNVRDVEVSAAWYARVLGMTRHDFQPPYGVARTSMKFGAMMLNLRPVDMDKVAWFTGAEAVAGSDDLCFLTDAVARRGRAPSGGVRRGGRGRAGRAPGSAGRDDLGLLPRPGRQPDRGGELRRSP